MPQQIAESNQRTRDMVRRRYASAYEPLFAESKEKEDLERRILVLCRGGNLHAEEKLIEVTAVTLEYQRFCVHKLVQALAPFVHATVGEMESNQLDDLVAVLGAPLEQCIRSRKLLRSDDQIGHEAVSRHLTDAVISAVAENYPREYLTHHGLSLAIWPALIRQLEGELTLTQIQSSKGILRTDSNATTALALALLPCSATMTQSLITTIGQYLEIDDSYANRTLALSLNDADVPTTSLEEWANFILPLLSYLKKFMLGAEFPDPLRATTGVLCGAVHKEAERALDDQGNPDNLLRVKALRDAAQLSVVKVMFLRLVVPHVVSAGKDPMRTTSERRIYLLAAHLMKTMIDGPPSSTRRQRSETLDPVLTDMSVAVENRLKSMVTEITYPFGNDELQHAPPKVVGAPRTIDSSRRTGGSAPTSDAIPKPASLVGIKKDEVIVAPSVDAEQTLDASSTPSGSNQPVGGIVGSPTHASARDRRDRARRTPALVRTEKRAQLSSRRPVDHRRTPSDTSLPLDTGSDAATPRLKRADEESKLLPAPTPTPTPTEAPLSPRSKFALWSPSASPRREVSEKRAPVSKKARQPAENRYAGAFPQFFANQETRKVLDRRLLALSHTEEKAVVPSQAITREYQRICIHGLVMAQAPFLPGLGDDELDALSRRLQAPLERCLSGLNAAKVDTERAQARTLLNNAVQSAVAVMFPERHLEFYALKGVIWPSLVNQLKKELEFTPDSLKLGIFRQSGSTPIKELSRTLQPLGTPLAERLIDVIQVFLENSDYAEWTKNVPLGQTGVPKEPNDVWNQFMTSVLLKAKAVLLSLKFPEAFLQTAATLFLEIDKQVQLELDKLNDDDTKTTDEKREKRALILNLQPGAKLSIVQQMFLRLVIPQVALVASDPATPEHERPVYKLVANALITMINLLTNPTKGQLSPAVDQQVIAMTPDVKRRLEEIVAEIGASSKSE